MMFDKLHNAKKTYDSVEIPPELESIIEESIRNSNEHKKIGKNKIGKYIAVGLCAVLCITIGVNFFAEKNTETSNEEGFAVNGESMTNAKTRSIDAPAGNPIVGMSDAVVAESFDKRLTGYVQQTIDECVLLENSAETTYDFREIYSDQMYYSYSITTYPSQTTRYFNLNKADGSKLNAELFFGETYNNDDFEFYIKSENTIVLIQDGCESEVRFGE